MTGELYAGKFSMDNSWYRVQICSVGSDRVEVLFVDYGNSELTTLNNLRTLDKSLETYPGQVSTLTDLLTKLVLPRLL